MAVLALLGGGVIGAFYLTSHSAHAQAQSRTSAGQASKEVQELLVDLDDLDTLHVLLPLKFTPEQMDKLSAAITSAKTEYDKKYTALSSAPLLKMADEIRETRKKAMAGTPVPTDVRRPCQGHSGGLQHQAQRARHRQHRMRSATPASPS